jgi:hypothetical protein
LLEEAVYSAVEVEKLAKAMGIFNAKTFYETATMEVISFGGSPTEMYLIATTAFVFENKLYTITTLSGTTNALMHFALDEQNKLLKARIKEDNIFAVVDTLLIGISLIPGSGPVRDAIKGVAGAIGTGTDVFGIGSTISGFFGASQLARLSDKILQNNRKGVKRFVNILGISSTHWVRQGLATPFGMIWSKYLKPITNSLSIPSGFG